MLIRPPGEKSWRVAPDTRGATRGRPGSCVTSLNCPGLQTLVAAHRAARSSGRVFRLRCGTSRSVLRPLLVTGLLTSLDVLDA